MKKLKYITALSVLIFITINFSSCLVPIEKQQESVDNLQKEYQQQILDHFHENENLFNKLVSVCFELFDKYDDFDNFNNITLWNGSNNNSLPVYNDIDFKNKYYFEIYKRIRDNNEKVYKIYDDFNTLDELSYGELDKILLNSIGYVLSCSNKDYITFYGNGSGWAYFSLIYTKTCEIMPINDEVHIEYTINDNWYIQYAFHQKG